MSLWVFPSVSFSTACMPKRHLSMDKRTHSQAHMLLVIPRVEIFSLQATHSLT